MKIGVIGAGRLGICFALLCEEAGYEVLVSDLREDYVESLNNREIITNEPEVSNLLKTAKNFRATTSNREVIDECDLIYTLVATPSLPDGSYNVSSVWDVVNSFDGVITVVAVAVVATTVATATSPMSRTASTTTMKEKIIVPSRYQVDNA